MTQKHTILKIISLAVIGFLLFGVFFFMLLTSFSNPKLLSVEKAYAQLSGGGGSGSGTGTGTGSGNNDNLGETEYGGMHYVSIYCDCSENFWNIVNDYASDETLMLIYEFGSSVLYLYYNLYGTYYLGTYDADANDDCEIEIYYDICVTLPDDGTMGMFPGTGTSGF